MQNSLGLNIKGSMRRNKQRNKSAWTGKQSIGLDRRFKIGGWRAIKPHLALARSGASLYCRRKGGQEEGAGTSGREILKGRQSKMIQHSVQLSTKT